MLLLVVSITIPAADVHSQDRSEIDLVNFAFSNYLGTGFYTSNSGEVFILKIPMSTTLRPMLDNEPGWVINYPVTLGTVNIDKITDGNIPGLSDVGTLSFIPGIEYHYPVSPIWQLIPFFDLGIARDIDSEYNRRVVGAGAKSFVTFDFGRKWLTLGNRLLFADQESFDRDNNSNFAVFETGLDYNFPTRFSANGPVVYLSFYYINYYYLEDLVLVDFLDAPIALENKNEIGFTVSLPKYSFLPDNSRIGLGVQVTKNDELYRLVFGTPFF